jgi:hypothetical protein
MICQWKHVLSPGIQGSFSLFSEDLRVEGSGHGVPLPLRLLKVHGQREVLILQILPPLLLLTEVRGQRAVLLLEFPRPLLAPGDLALELAVGPLLPPVQPHHLEERLLHKVVVRHSDVPLRPGGALEGLEQCDGAGLGVVHVRGAAHLVDEEIDPFRATAARRDSPEGALCFHGGGGGVEVASVRRGINGQVCH